MRSDAILADETGILVLRPDDVDSVDDQALEMQCKEVITRHHFAAGETISAIAGTGKLLAKMMGKGVNMDVHRASVDQAGQGTTPQQLQARFRLLGL